MKHAWRVRRSLKLLMVTTALVHGAVSHAMAQASPYNAGIAPSIEVHGDVIESLRATQPAPADRAPVNAIPDVAPIRSPQPIMLPAETLKRQWGGAASTQGVLTLPKREAMPVPQAIPQAVPFSQGSLPQGSLPSLNPTSPLLMPGFNAPGTEAVAPAAPVKEKRSNRDRRKKRAKKSAPSVVHTQPPAAAVALPEAVLPPKPAIAPEVKAKPTDTEKAQMQWRDRFPQPSSKPAQPVISVPAQPEPVAPIVIPEPVISAPALPPKDTSAQPPLPPISVPEALPALPQIAEPAAPVALPELPMPAAPQPEEKAPEKAPELAPLPLPEVSAPIETPQPKALPPVAAAPAVVPPAQPEGFGMMDDVKRLMRKMLGKEPEPLRAITTPIPVPVIDTPPAPIIPAAPQPAATMDVPPVPVAVPEPVNPLPDVLPQAKPTPPVMEKKAVQKPAFDALAVPPLPPEPASAPEDLAPLPPLPLPDTAPEALVPARPAPEPKRVKVPEATQPPLPAAAPQAMPSSELPPISMLSDDGDATALPPLPMPVELPALPEPKAVQPKVVKVAPKADVPVRRVPTDGRTVKATPVPEVGNSDLPPILSVPPLMSEDAAPLSVPAPAPAAPESATSAMPSLPPLEAPGVPASEIAPPLPELPAPAMASAKPSSPAGSVASVPFPKDELRLPPSAEGVLSGALSTVQGATGKRVLVVAYASGANEEQARAARKIALSRGLAVRGWLIDKGVDKLRINVQAKVDKGANADRVDLVLE